MYNYTVSQVSTFIKDIIDNEPILENITVIGEVSSFSISRNIAYFSIKDKDSELNCMMYSPKSAVEIGEQILVTGSVKFYKKHGKITFTAYDIELFGQGKIYLQFIKLKNELEKLGYFDDEHKLKKPDKIERIGVVTSATGAVIHDIHKVIKRRNPHIDIVVYDVKVQGDGASQEIANGINFFSDYDKVDAVIVARGGGSNEDLSPFNTEIVAKAGYNCKKFLISAVGHEVDTTLLDMVADVRASTPSVAAELISTDLFDIKQKLRKIINFMQTKLNLIKQQLNTRFKITFQDITKQITLNLDRSKNTLNNFLNSLNIKINDLMNSTKYRIGIDLNTLDKLNPIKILERGFSVVTLDGKNINDANCNVGSSINIKTNKLNILAKVLEVSNETRRKN